MKINKFGSRKTAGMMISPPIDLRESEGFVLFAVVWNDRKVNKGRKEEKKKER